MSSTSEKAKRIAFKTIKKYGLVKEGSNIFVALSGGKDSATALFLLSEFIKKTQIDCKLKAFHLDFGFDANKVEVVRKQAELAGVDIKIVNVKDELGISLQDVMTRASRPICSACGVLKRYIMNKLPREMGATELATGHQLDDFLVFYFKNLLGRNFSWISKFRPRLDSTHPKLLAKIRPLFFVSGKENEEFCRKNRIPFLKEDVCPLTKLNCRIDVKRKEWYGILDYIDSKQKNFKHQMALSIVEIGKFFQSKEELRVCTICKEPTNKEICSFCRLFRKVDKNYELEECH